MDTTGILKMLDWQWLFPPLEKDAGPLQAGDRATLTEELHRFIAVKIKEGDLDGTNNFAPTGLVDKAFHILLLHPFFCANMMKLLNKTGHVLSHVPAERDDHGDRVQQYLKHYRKLFKTAPPATLPSGLQLWPGGKRAAPPASVRNTPAPTRSRTEIGVPGRATTRQNSVFMKTLTDKTIPIDIGNAGLGNFTLWNLAEKIQEKEGAPVDQQRMIFKGVQVFSHDCNDGHEATQRNNRSLLACGISLGSTVHLVLKLRGC